MKSIVGLGNPGERYRGTRHNLGFRVVEGLKSRLQARPAPARDSYWIAKCKVGPEDVHLIKPMTFMNCSGHGLMDYLVDYGPNLSDILVVCDDVYLPLGKIRLRRSGGDGGHNGMASIVEFLRTDAFPRMRIGVGSPANSAELATYVLRPFLEEEVPVIEGGIARACDAAISFVEEGLEAAMNKFNG